MDRFRRILSLLGRNDPIINTLNMSSVPLTDDMTDELISALNHNSFISSISLQANSLSSSSSKKIFSLLLSNPILVSITITENKLDDDSIQFLSIVLQNLPASREPICLVLRRNSFGAAGASHLADALRRNVPVRWLDLRYNREIGDKGVEAIALSLSQNTVLVGLELIKCGCDELGAAALADSLLDNQTLTTLLLQDELRLPAIHSLAYLLSDAACRLQGLYLWHCDLTTADKIEVLCRSLRSNRTIAVLALSYNRINDVGGLYLSDMILRNRGIVKLQLGANDFSPTTAGFFGVALGRNSTLQFLDFSRNHLRAEGIWALAVSLRGNKSLKTLDLRFNRINPTASEMLCDLISETAIRTLRLSGNPLGDDTIRLLADRLKGNSVLRELELNEVQMTSQGFISLCNALKENNRLEKISLSDNRLCPLAMRAFAELLGQNAALFEVGMKNCLIDDEGCEYLADGIASNATLTDLDISGNRIDVHGAQCLLDALLGNYSLGRILYAGNPFSADADSPFSVPIADFLERNNYYTHNLLMRDMAALVNDSSLA
jgi:Ran GTPase-activating protein (RanGAP) involved in mRNA processing and transport